MSPHKCCASRGDKTQKYENLALSDSTFKSIFRKFYSVKWARADYANTRKPNGVCYQRRTPFSSWKFQKIASNILIGHCQIMTPWYRFLTGGSTFGCKGVWRLHSRDPRGSCIPAFRIELFGMWAFGTVYFIFPPKKKKVHFLSRRPVLLCKKDKRFLFFFVSPTGGSRG